MSVRVADLFSGCGGTSEGARQAGLEQAVRDGASTMGLAWAA